MRSGFRMSLLVMLVILPACVSGEEPADAVTFVPAIRPDQMRPHIEFLASPKRAGRAGSVKAESRSYIIDQWKAMGLRPLFAKPSPDAPEGEAIPSFEQAIPGPVAEDGSTSLMGHNIGAWLPGSDPQLSEEIVILSAHYDHLGARDDSVFTGADDNASGVAMLIEAARQFSSDKVAPRRSIAFVAFDLEERMLWGSRWFAAHPPWPIERVKFFMTADMIGRSLGDLPLPAVFVMGSERAPQLRAALDDIGTPAGLEVCRLGADIVGTRSDYGPFRDRQIPFLFFSTGEHPDYHTPGDTADKIDYDKAARIASLMLKVTRQIADATQPPVWSDPDNLRLEEPRVLHRITTLLLEADQHKPLTQTQRFLVTNVQNRSRKIMDAKMMTADDRVWLVRMAQALMLSVF